MSLRPNFPIPTQRISPKSPAPRPTRRDRARAASTSSASPRRVLLSLRSGDKDARTLSKEERRLALSRFSVAAVARASFSSPRKHGDPDGASGDEPGTVLRRRRRRRRDSVCCCCCCCCCWCVKSRRDVEHRTRSTFYRLDFGAR